MSRTDAAKASINSPSAFQCAFAVSRETTDRLVVYEDLLKRWQKTINLVAPSTLPIIWSRHFADSAQLWAHRPKSAVTYVDLGSGAGFPGLVLAILAAECDQSRHTLVESDSRKAAFLRECARTLGLAVDILCTRIENPETQSRVATADCVTARALAPLIDLAGLVQPYFASHTVGLFLKGRDADAEVQAARRRWSFDAELAPSLTDPDGRIVILSALKPKT